jgi:sulfur carrier protein
VCLVVNGEPREVKHSATVSQLLEELGIEAQRVAVLLNDEAVPAPRRSLTPLHEGDRVELLTFAAGG